MAALTKLTGACHKLFRTNVRSLTAAQFLLCKEAVTDNIERNDQGYCTVKALFTKPNDMLDVNQELQALEQQKSLRAMSVSEPSSPNSFFTWQSSRL